jgi:hypothetical protein
MSDRKAKKEHLPTAPPPFDPEEFARESESMVVGKPTASMHPTMPPEPFYQELRESCSDSMEAAEPSPDSYDFQSEVRVLSSAPLPRDIPSLDSVPFIAMQADDLAWFDLPADAKSVLALVDGSNSVGTIVTKSRLGPDETCQLLRELLNLAILDVR